MANGGKITAYLDLDASGVKKGAEEAKQAIQGIENDLGNMESGFKSLEKTGAILTAGVTLPLVGFAKTSVDTAKDFEYSMSEVQAISGASSEELKKLEEQAKTLGATTFYSAQEASQGMKYYAMAGYDTKEIMDAMPASVDLAVASNTDLATVCDIVSDAMTGLQMSTEETTHFTDILAKTATSTNTTVEMLGESFKYCSPVAGTLGIKAEDLSVALGLMANAGVKSTIAGNNLKTGLLRLSAPTNDMVEAMEKYNIELKTNEDGTVDLMKTMTSMRSSLKNLDSVTQANVLSTIMGKEATAGWSAIINSTDEDFQSLTESIYNCDGTAKEIAETMGNNFEGKMKSLESAFEGVKIAIGDLLIPALTTVVEKVTDVCNWFNELDEGSQNLIVGFGGFLAVLGPVLLILPKVIKGCGLLKAGFLALKAGIGLTVGATTALTVGLSVVITALLGFMTYVGSSSDMLTSLQDNFGTFGVVVGGVCEFLYGTFQLTFGNIGILISTLGKMLMALMKGDFKEVGNIWKDGWAKMEANTAKAGSNMAMETTRSIKKIREMSATELASLEGTFDSTMSTLKTVTADNIDEATSVFVEQLKGMDNESISLLSGTSDSMAMLFNNITANMTDEQATNVFKNNLEAMVRSGELSLEQLEKDTAEFSKTVANNISTGASQVEQAGETLWTNFKNVSTRGIEEVASSTVADIQKMNTDTFNELKNAGDNWGQLFDGIVLDGSMSTSELEKKVVENFKNMNMSGTELMEVLKSDITNKFNQAGTEASNATGNMANEVNADLQAILSETGVDMSQVENIISTTTSNAKTNAETNMNGVSNAVNQGTSNAGANAEANMGKVKTAIESNTNVSGTVSGNMNAVSKAINDATSGATKTAENNTRGMKTAVEKNTKDLSKTADTNFKAIDRSAKTHFTTATDKVKKDATSMYNGAKTSFSKLADTASSSMRSLKDNVVSYTNSMKTTAISNWSAIRSEYAKSITGTITITKTTIEKTQKVTETTSSGGKSISRASLFALSDDELRARQEAVASLSNIEVGGKMAVSRADDKDSNKEKTQQRESNKNITYNYTYTSPKEASISELRRKDRVQAQRLALSFR